MRRFSANASSTLAEVRELNFLKEQKWVYIFGFTDESYRNGVVASLLLQLTSVPCHIGRWINVATSRGKFHRVQLLVPMQMVRAIDRMINGCTRMAVEKNEYIEYGMPDGSTMATTILG